MNSSFVMKRVLLALALLGGIAQPALADEVLGRLGSVELNTGEVKKMLDGMDPQAKARVEASRDNLSRFVSLELVRERLVSEARAKGWDKRPEVLEAMEQAKQQVLVSFYLNSFLQPDSGYPSDDQVKSFYEANKTQFLAPKQYHVAQIYVSVPEGADAAAADERKKKAYDLAAQARAGADFAELARNNSEHRETASKGGDAGWISDSQLVPAIRSALSALEINATSSPVRTPQGWHVLKLLDVKPPAIRPLDEMRDAIIAELRARKTRENEAGYRSDLVRQTPPVIDEAELAKLWNSIHR